MDTLRPSGAEEYVRAFIAAFPDRSVTRAMAELCEHGSLTWEEVAELTPRVARLYGELWEGGRNNAGYRV